MSKSKKPRKPKAKTRFNAGTEIEKLRNDMVGMSYQWRDEGVIQFLADEKDARDYQIDPRSVRFDHTNKAKKLYCKAIFRRAKQVISGHIPFKWAIDIDAEFLGENGKTWAFNEEFAATATLDDLAPHVTSFFDEAIDKAKEVSKGPMGQLTFKAATFRVTCEGY
jgi:hypothetical protein